MFQLLIGYTAHAYGADEVRNPLFEVSVLRLLLGLAAWHVRERTCAVHGPRAWIHTHSGGAWHKQAGHAAREAGRVCARMREARGSRAVLTAVAPRPMQIKTGKGSSIPPVDGITRSVAV
jgi:hypothetical protein